MHKLIRWRRAECQIRLNKVKIFPIISDKTLVGLVKIRGRVSENWGWHPGRPRHLHITLNIHRFWISWRTSGESRESEIVRKRPVSSPGAHVSQTRQGKQNYLISELSHTPSEDTLLMGKTTGDGLVSLLPAKQEKNYFSKLSELEKKVVQRSKKELQLREKDRLNCFTRETHFKNGSIKKL